MLSTKKYIYECKYTSEQLRIQGGGGGGGGMILDFNNL